MALRYFNAAGADPDGELGEDHSPGDPPDSARDRRRRTAGAALQVFGDDYPTPDGTCLRDYIHVTDLADAHVKALEALAEAGRSGAYNLGTGRPHSVREVIDSVERVTGRPVPWTLGPRRPGDPAVLYAAPQKAQAELHWKPRFAELDAIVRTAWDWHRAHPHGYRATTDSFVNAPNPLRRLFRYAMPYRGAARVGGRRDAAVRRRAPPAWPG